MLHKINDLFYSEIMFLKDFKEKLVRKLDTKSTKNEYPLCCCKVADIS